MNGIVFSYSTLLTVGIIAVSTYFGTWINFWENQRLQQEAELQKAVIEGSVNEEAEPGRIPPRITRIAAAARTFFNHNRLMTMLSITDPVTRRVELDMLRRFVHGTQLAEHAARQKILPRVSLSVWEATGSYRDELATMADRDPVIYRMVMDMPMLSPHDRQPIVQQLCGKLMGEHTRRQMD